MCVYRNFLQKALKKVPRNFHTKLFKKNVCQKHLTSICNNHAFLCHNLTNCNRRWLNYLLFRQKQTLVDILQIFSYSCYFDNTTIHSGFPMHIYGHWFLKITATWWYCCMVAPFVTDYFQEPMPTGVHICNYYKNNNIQTE
jgi:hypothetical protein